MAHSVYLFYSRAALIHVLHAQRDLLNATGKACLVASDADVIGDRRLIVEANVGGLICRENQGLRLLDSAFGDGLSIDGNGDLAAFANVVRRFLPS